MPPQLFSHNDQQSQWQTSRPDDANANGWGGRIADLLYAQNAGALPMSITASGTNLFQRGSEVNQYGIDPSGATAMNYLGGGPETWIIGDGPIDDDIAAHEALTASGTQSHVLERAFADVNSNAIANYKLVGAALQSAPPLTTKFPNSDLGNQLAMVAKLISVRSALGMSRQVFFVSAGNYDTHNDQIDNQSDNLTELSQAAAAFYNATAELGIANNVTAFTASDFGRTLQANSTGTDHGWGGHHFVDRRRRARPALLRHHAEPEERTTIPTIPAMDKSSRHLPWINMRQRSRAGSASPPRTFRRCFRIWDAFQKRIWVSCSALIFSTATAHAATYVVAANSDMTFTPATITIFQHDQITFVNSGGLHNVRADNNSFWCADDCSLHRAPSSKAWQDTITFDTLGTFGYFCEQHGDLTGGMRGTIVVIDEHIFGNGFDVDPALP